MSVSIDVDIEIEPCTLADTNSSRPIRIEIYFVVFKSLYLCFSFIKLAENLQLCLVKRIL